MKPNRRDFIRQLSLACGSILFVPACVGYDSPWRFFTEKESKTVIAFAGHATNLIQITSEIPAINAIRQFQIAGSTSE
jgi:hypothetical protein